MLTRKTIGFLGSGNLAEALIKGLLASSKINPGQIIASDRINERLIHLAESYEVKVLSKNFETARNADIIFLTVKPGDVEGVLREIAPEIEAGKLLISTAAGITTSRILEVLKEAGLSHFLPVVRAMPNTPATVREGVTVLCAGLGTGERHLEFATEIFGSIGKVVAVKEESLMDAVTGLSGSGPAYVFLFIEALIEGGVRAGLPADTSKELAFQTVLGAVKLAMESPMGLDALRRMVASPGGTTIEGLRRLEEGGLKETVASAVIAATKRARELSGGK
ncbi:pyrroline-5-carboxylate reductase [bacterium]|nr:pyrroline-5-carboxylate reductase [bacterium]